MAVSILPGGPVVAPAGEQHVAAGEPLSLAVNAAGKIAVAVNYDPRRPSLTVLEYDKQWQTRELPSARPNFSGDPSTESGGDRWRTVSGGLTFAGSRSVFVSEGETGRISVIDLETGERTRKIELTPGSISGALAADPARHLLYVGDLVHSRVVILDTRSRRSLAAVALEGVPGMLALGPDRQKLYVTTAKNLLQPGGVAGPAVSIIDVAQPEAPQVAAVIRVDQRPGATLGGIAAVAGRLFVSDDGDDSIAVIDTGDNHLATRIPIRIPGFDNLRGVMPMGIAYDPHAGRLLVAEAGINAVAIVDPQSARVLGHVPVGWFPTQVLLDHGNVFVANEKGWGSGPAPRGTPGQRGSISLFPLPQDESLPSSTRLVMEANGFVARPGAPPPLPDGIRHVLLIVKEGRSFDEVLGDMTHASNGNARAVPELARFGHDGYVDGERERLSLHHLNVTPNHHAIARQWTFSDNFYADTETAAEGMRRLSAWSHLAAHGISFYRFEEPFDPAVRDTDRATRFIADIEEKFPRSGRDLPQFLMARLPNDRMAAPHPTAGYPYAASYLADNDVALGRILQYFSSSKWWNQTVVFVTEASAGGLDHIDPHRTLLLCAGPWARNNWVSHMNAGFPGLLKTIFRLLGVPPRDLSDASSADLSDCFADQPNPAPYRALDVDPRLYK